MLINKTCYLTGKVNMKDFKVNVSFNVAKYRNSSLFFANNPFSASKIANKDQGNIGKQVLFFRMEFSNLVHCAYILLKTYVSTL